MNGRSVRQLRSKSKGGVYLLHIFDSRRVYNDDGFVKNTKRDAGWDGFDMS